MDTTIIMIASREEIRLKRMLLLLTKLACVRILKIGENGSVSSNQNVRLLKLVSIKFVSHSKTPLLVQSSKDQLLKPHNMVQLHMCVCVLGEL